MKTNTRALSLAGAFTLMAVSLTGCGSAASSQTALEACDYLVTEFSEYLPTVQGELAELTLAGDMNEVIVFQKGLIVKYESFDKGIHNPEVKAAYGELLSIVKETVPLMEKMIEDPSFVVSDEYSDFNERADVAAAGLDKVCPGAAIIP